MPDVNNVGLSDCSHLLRRLRPACAVWDSLLLSGARLGFDHSYGRNAFRPRSTRAPGQGALPRLLKLVRTLPWRTS